MSIKIENSIRFITYITYINTYEVSITHSPTMLSLCRIQYYSYHKDIMKNTNMKMPTKNIDNYRIRFQWVSYEI